MDDIPAGQLATGGVSRLGVSNRAVLANPLQALLLDLKSAAPEDGAGHTGPVLQMGIGGIDDGVHGLTGDIALYDLKALSGWISITKLQDAHVVLQALFYPFIILNIKTGWYLRQPPR